MGVDFTHCDASWTYSGFHRFRAHLAKDIGIDLDAMDGFGGDTSWDTVDDPIKPLLNHSDCDGELTPGECAQVAPRLRELVAGWSDLDYDKYAALKLADGMDNAAAQGEALRFC